MTPLGRTILGHLRAVEHERAVRTADPDLDRRVREVKAYQHARFGNTYTDLLANPRYTAATRFFLEELYGPHDFTERDAQFARIVPALVRLFPAEVVETVAALAELHALSESLDTAMARWLADRGLSAADYVRAWQGVGRLPERERQVELSMAIGGALERYTRNPVLRHGLRMMRGPAGAAGLSRLQRFLERGFECFGAMRGADEFLSTIASRERALGRRLFEPTAVADATVVSHATHDPLGQLP